MTLGQFATAVGAPPRWVLNALTRLRIPRRYTEPLARRLTLARLLAEGIGAPLPEAFALAGRALAETDPYGTWRYERPGGISVVIEMPGFFNAYLPRLSLARTHYAERLRGRRLMRRGTAGERARAYGVDTTLLDSALRRTTEQRLRMLTENVEFLNALRRRAP